MTQTPITTDPDMPAASYHPSHDDFEQPHLGEDDPAAVTEVEQLIRVAFSIGGLQNGTDLAFKAAAFQKEYEAENVVSDFTVDRSHIEESNDVFAKQKLNEFADKRQETLNEEKEWWDKREYWYDEIIRGERSEPKSIRAKVKKANSMLTDGVTFKTVEIVADGDASGPHEVADRRLPYPDAAHDIREFGFEPPITVTVCESADSGNLYPFVPWFGTTVCTCRTQDAGPATLCKHELAALIQYARDKYDPDGPSVPERFKRLVSPHAYNRFTNNISP